ncbi:MAG TPA: hypothetical protein PKM40_00385 [Bacteroidia bacterium]|nr:hypothetical protein [Bacteroidia bacterium]
MWLFKKRKKKESENGVSDKVAGKIAGFGIAIQTRFATTMNKLFEKMNHKRLKIWLALFCIICGGYSIYLLSNAIISPTANQQSIKIDPVKIPRHYDNTGDGILSSDNVVDEETFQKIQAFKSYMDSLKFAGNKEYDSILTARPYLMDTLQMLEQIYYSQKQK